MDALYNRMEEMCGYDREEMHDWLEYAMQFLEDNWDAYVRDDESEEEHEI